MGSGTTKRPAALLHESPFGDFLIPGSILCVVLGLGAFLVAAALFFLPAWSWAERLNPFSGQHWSWTAACGVGLALMIWISVQVALIGGGSWLQPFYFAVGLAILLAALTPSVREYLTPRSQPPSAPPDLGSTR
jgi:hypothetical protein